ncbi:hypothetical protein [Archangium lipolyticum]|uniref:hypothetical protein n=1 Tax=Archangium lipolyticum TaxID=2970465 RepID=UPI00214A0B18|nr:hypothetical protein [Archangium lipolyticum]
MLPDMRSTTSLLRMALALSFALAAACVTSRAQIPVDGGQQQAQAPSHISHRSEASQSVPHWASALPTADHQARATTGGLIWADPLPVLIHILPGGRLRLALPALAPHPDSEKLSLNEVRPLRVAFDSFQPRIGPRLRLMMESSGAIGAGPVPTAPWELRLREDFLSQFGPSLLPIPESLETSRLYLALKLSTRYMDDGIREAAQELFSAPAFLASVSLSVLVYFAAWLAPEPLFSKAFAAALTVRLSLLVGVVELSRLAMACLRLYQEAEAANTPQELEAASERFGKSLGGTLLRVLVVVASLGVPQVLPKVPEGGVWTLLSPLRHAPAGGPALQSVATTQIVADGTLVVTGVAAGTSATALCGELATCAIMDGAGGTSGGGPKLSTRYGKPHTRQNPPHNEAIEQELARREAAGHTGLRKNKPQLNAEGKPLDDPALAGGVRFRKPDVSSVRPDGVRHNTNYVSNSRDMQRELDAFEAMLRADRSAIHELYLLDGTLVRRYVPPGVSFPLTNR